MSENNHNEADALFATRRKKQQDEEAQKAAKLAEEERIAELERQKQQVAEEIKRLETLQALQKEQEEKQALLEQQAREEKAAQDALAAQKAAEKAAKAAERNANKAPFDIKKYLPFILIGAGVLVVAIVVIIVVAASGKGNSSENSLSAVASKAVWYRQTNEITGVTYVYPSVFDRIDNMDFGESYDVYDYHDEESGQRLIMAICADVVTAEDKLLYSSEELMKYSLTSAMESDGAKNYTFNKQDEDTYYATNSLDDVELGEDMVSIITGIKNDMCLVIYCYVSRNETACPRNIKLEDLLDVFNIMIDHMALG